MNQKYTDIRHELLSEIHRLLSIASADDFYAAGRLCKSENIKLALEALAEEHLNDSGTEGYKSRTQSQPKPVPQDRGVNFNSEAKFVGPSLPQLRDIVSTSRFVATRPDLLNFAKVHGLRISPSNRDGLARLVPKVAKHLASLSDADKARAVSELIGSSDLQTAGWMQVIRKRR